MDNDKLIMDVNEVIDKLESIKIGRASYRERV